MMRYKIHMALNRGVHWCSVDRPRGGCRQEAAAETPPPRRRRRDAAPESSAPQVNYRLNAISDRNHPLYVPVRPGQHRLPTPVLDVARALQFLRTNAQKFSIDKSRVGVAGASAGGCTALWIAFHDDLAEPFAP